LVSRRIVSGEAGIVLPPARVLDLVTVNRPHLRSCQRRFSASLLRRPVEAIR
jgi:hypothetical protein